MTGLDTNVLLRLLISEAIWPDDQPGQTAAVAALMSQGKQRFFVNAVVLVETLWVISKRMRQPKSVIVDVIDRLLVSSNLELQHREAVQAARHSFNRSKAGVHDRLIAELNAAAGCAWTFTFDKDASKTPGFKLLVS